VLEILEPAGGHIDLEAGTGGFDIESEAGGLWSPSRQPGGDGPAQAQALLVDFAHGRSHNTLPFCGRVMLSV